MTKKKAIPAARDRAGAAWAFIVTRMADGLDRPQTFTTVFVSKDHKRQIKIQTHEGILLVQKFERKRDPVLGYTTNLDRGVAMDAGIDDVRSAMEWLEQG